MNKIKVGNANSPNLKKIQSKVGSLANASHRPGGGEFKIKSQKLEWKAAPRTDALNDKYVPGGGTKKVSSFDLTEKFHLRTKKYFSAFQIENRKLDWNTSSRVGSLDNATHRAG